MYRLQPAAGDLFFNDSLLVHVAEKCNLEPFKLPSRPS
jgi:hypothetical protein